MAVGRGAFIKNCSCIFDVVLHVLDIFFIETFWDVFKSLFILNVFIVYGDLKSHNSELIAYFYF